MGATCSKQEWMRNVYNIVISELQVKTQDYWVLRLCPSSGILKTRKHNFSETGYVSVLR
jgi:hypothetical protein